MSADFTTLTIDRDGAVATVTMNRPDSLNAFDDALKVELLEAFKLLGRDDSVRSIILTGAGRGFSSGQDLEELKELYATGQAPDLGSVLRTRYNPLIARMRSLPKPIVAAINGVAAGAGCSLAMACDIRVASSKASFVEAFVHVGLVPDSGGTFLLPRLVGLGQAMEMCLTGRKVPAEEALRIGLVSRVVEPEALVGTTRELADMLADLPTRAIGLTKKLLNESFSRDLDEQLESEAFAQATAARTSDHLEGIQAFLKKRKPKFTGQ